MKASHGFRIGLLWAAFALLALLPALPLLAAEGQALPKTLELGRAVGLIRQRCLECHAWADSYEGIEASGLVIPGKPEESELYAMVASGRMPLSGKKLDKAELGLIRDWILAGAPAPAPEALGPPAPEGGAGQSAGFLGFPNKTAYHRAAGWTSAGLLLAAGVVGSIHAYDLMSTAHAYRDSLGITEEDQIGQPCYDEIAGLWGDGSRQALRWTHVGLLVAGEGIYLGNAITGMSMSTAGLKQEGVSRGDLHRWGFFIHAGLMATEIVLGFFTTEALRRGDHETVSSLGVAHAAVGLTIPLVIVASGLEIDWGRKKTAGPEGLSAPTL